MSSPLTASEILALLAADPELAWAVAQEFRVGGPWVRFGAFRWSRRSQAGGICADDYGNGRYAMERADNEMRACGYILVGGVPDEVPATCLLEREMVQGRPRGHLPTDPRRVLPCHLDTGHAGRCRSLHARDDGNGVCWWGEP